MLNNFEKWTKDKETDGQKDKETDGQKEKRQEKKKKKETLVVILQGVHKRRTLSKCLLHS